MHQSLKQRMRRHLHETAESRDNRCTHKMIKKFKDTEIEKEKEKTQRVSARRLKDKKQTCKQARKEKKREKERERKEKQTSHLTRKSRCSESALDEGAKHSFASICNVLVQTEGKELLWSDLVYSKIERKTSRQSFLSRLIPLTWKFLNLRSCLCSFHACRTLRIFSSLQLTDMSFPTSSSHFCIFSRSYSATCALRLFLHLAHHKFQLANRVSHLTA